MTPWELRARRVKAGLSLKALAMILGMSPRTVSLWEKGNHVMPRVCQIAVNAVLRDIEDGNLQVRAAHLPEPHKRGPIARWIRNLVTTYL